MNYPAYQGHSSLAMVSAPRTHAHLENTVDPLVRYPQYQSSSRSVHLARPDALNLLASLSMSTRDYSDCIPSHAGEHAVDRLPALRPDHQKPSAREDLLNHSPHVPFQIYNDERLVQNAVK
jgi:hypothetical protein